LIFNGLFYACSWMCSKPFLSSLYFHQFR